MFATNLKKLVRILPALAIIAAATGCAQRRDEAASETTKAELAVLMPQQIQIVEAFTRFASFNDDASIDGIQLRLRPLDEFGEPVRITGQLRAELYTRIPASAERDGLRVCPPWEVSLATDEDQRKYWNRLTGMYEIPLKFPAALDPHQRAFMLSVVYTTPLDSRLFDECELDLPRTGH